MLQMKFVEKQRKPLTVIGGNGNVLEDPLKLEANKNDFVQKFKTFSIYEDGCEDKGGIQESKKFINKLKSDVIVQPDESPKKPESLAQNELSFNEEMYNLNQTPVSESMDLTSPPLSNNSESPSASVDSEPKIKKRMKLRRRLQENDSYKERFDVAEYKSDILIYLQKSEAFHRPNPNYMKFQKDIESPLREVLIDWMAAACIHYNLDDETLFLSVSYMDRFLSHMMVARTNLQPVAATAMFIASKYEEIHPLDIDELISMTDGACNREQILTTERTMLKVLEFRLYTPTPYVFLNCYAVFAHITSIVKCLAQYWCELTIYVPDVFLQYFPSSIASASIALASYVFGNQMWSPELKELTSYNLKDLKEIIWSLVELHNKATTMELRNIADKYSELEYEKVSSLQAFAITKARLGQIIQEYYQQIETECFEEMA